VRFERTVTPALLGIALLGCDRLHDVKRCRELAREVNGKLDAVEQELAPTPAGSASAGPAGSAYAKAAKHYQALSHSLGDFDGGSAELEKTVDELSSVSRAAARQTAALASALDAKNDASALVATRELERLAKHEKTLVQRIDDECRPK